MLVYRIVDRIENPNIKGKWVLLDVGGKDMTMLSELISASDLVISLLPATMHVGIAELCIQNKTSLVTSSYISNEMLAMDER